MPQIYRRHSEYISQRPSGLEPRRRTTLLPPPSSSSQQSQQLQPTDADGSIYLSDLVRTGEASRLRRRGAMRLDHGILSATRPNLAPQPASSSPSTSSNPANTATAPNAASQPILVSPSRVTTPPWVIADPGGGGGGGGDDEFTYGGQEWREWNSDEPGDSSVPMQLDDIQERNENILGPTATAGAIRASQPVDAEEAFMLFCGGEGRDIHAELAKEFSISRPFEPSPLPLYPSQHVSTSTSASTSTSCPNSRPSKKSNGCGAVVHMRAFPQRPRGVWVGKEEATDVVVGLDASYFERSVVAKMMKSACGCIREGIGCAVCGNTLGTRYMPCQAASEGIFSGSGSASSTRPCRPTHPSGPRYWGCRTSSASTPTPSSSRLLQPQPSGSSSSTPISSTRSPSNFYVYTFFSDHVSSSPACDFGPSSTLTSMRREVYTSSEDQSQDREVDSRRERERQRDRDRDSRESRIDQTERLARSSSPPSRPIWYNYTFTTSPLPYRPQTLPSPSAPTRLSPIPFRNQPLPSTLGASDPYMPWASRIPSATPSHPRPSLSRTAESSTQTSSQSTAGATTSAPNSTFQPANIPTPFFPSSVSLPPPPQLQPQPRPPLLDLDIPPSVSRVNDNNNRLPTSSVSDSNGEDEDTEIERAMGMGMSMDLLDADGVLVDTEPNSPDKVGGEGGMLMWPGR